MLRNRLASFLCFISLALTSALFCPQPVSVDVLPVSSRPAVEASCGLTYQPPVSRPEKVMFAVTAYSLSDPGMPRHGLTATGIRPKSWHTAAADPRILPFGTKLYIPALVDTPSGGWFVVEDTGGAIYGRRLDLYFESKAEALRFGRHTLEVYIYR